MAISVSPILRKSYTEAMDSFCDNHKLQIAALLDHVSYHGPPLIGLLQKEIRGHTGIDTFSSGLGLILTASATLDGQIKAGRFRYNAAVFSKFRVSAIHIAIQTARTNFLTANKGFTLASYHPHNFTTQVTISTIVFRTCHYSDSP